MRHWTKDEDDALVFQCTRNAHCLKKAFENTSRIIGRSKTACAQRWYSYVSKDPETAVCFATISQKGVNKNRKNALGDGRNKLGWWKKVLKVLGF